MGSSCRDETPWTAWQGYCRAEAGEQASPAHFRRVEEPLMRAVFKVKVGAALLRGALIAAEPLDRRIQPGLCA